MLKKSLPIFVVLFASLAWGQSMTKTSSHSGSLAMVDHHPHCGGSGTLNCWHQESSTFNGLWYSPKGGVLATDASGCVWSGSSPTGLITWTKQTSLGCNLTNVEYDANGNLYALDTGTGNLKFVEDQSGSWHQVNGATAVQFSIAKDGEEFFAKINAAHALNTTTDPTHAWTQNGSGYIWVDALSSQNWLLVKTNGTVWLSSHGNLSQIGTNSNAVQVHGAFDVDQAGNPMVYYLGSDGCTYHMNPSATTGWDKLNGCGMTALATGGRLRTMSLGGTGGTHLYRFGETSPTLTISYSGNVNCNVPNPPGPGYCAQFNHTAHITACWGTKGCNTTNATPWNGVGSWGITATSAPQDDPIACLDNPLADGCAPNENGNMNCSGGGSDTQSNDYDYGSSIDVRRYNYDEQGYPEGPILEGTGAAGTWTGTDFFYHSDACISGVPTCPTSNPLQWVDNCTFFNPQFYIPCYDQVYFSIYNDVRLGSPWVIIQAWIEELSTGVTICAPTTRPYPTEGNMINAPLCH